MASAVKWLQRWRENKSAAPKPRGGSISPLEQFATEILALVAKQPDLTLLEIVAELRKRWGSESVLVIDKGDYAIVRPIPADILAALHGKYAGPGPNTDEMRATAREEEREILSRRRTRRPAAALGDFQQGCLRGGTAFLKLHKQRAVFALSIETHRPRRYPALRIAVRQSP